MLSYRNAWKGEFSLSLLGRPSLHDHNFHVKSGVSEIVGQLLEHSLVSQVGAYTEVLLIAWGLYKNFTIFVNWGFIVDVVQQCL